MDELVSNFAPPVAGLLAAAAGLLYARHVRHRATQRRDVRRPDPKPAE